MYTTTDLGQAAFLQLRGHEVRINVNENGYWVFHFDPSVKRDVTAYQQGAVVPARIFSQIMRQLKARASRARA